MNKTGILSRSFGTEHLDLKFTRVFCYAMALLTLFVGVLMIPRLGLSKNGMLLGIVLMVILSVQLSIAGQLVELSLKSKKG